jgi:hypothetical protein
MILSVVCFHLSRRFIDVSKSPKAWKWGNGSEWLMLREKCQGKTRIELFYYEKTGKTRKESNWRVKDEYLIVISFALQSLLVYQERRRFSDFCHETCISGQTLSLILVLQQQHSYCFSICVTESFCVSLVLSFDSSSPSLWFILFASGFLRNTRETSQFCSYSTIRRKVISSR